MVKPASVKPVPVTIAVAAGAMFSTVSASKSAPLQLHARDHVVRKQRRRVERRKGGIMSILRDVEDLPVGENAAIAGVNQLSRQDVARPVAAVDRGRGSREILAVIQQFVVAAAAASEAGKVSWRPQDATRRR